MKKIITILILTALIAVLSACTPKDEYSLDELERMGTAGVAELLAKTVYKPWRGQEFLPGKVSGTWHSVMKDDPKSFNHLIAEQDSTTRSVVGSTTDYLLDYDYYNREWIPNAASAQIVSEPGGSMQVIYTLRDDLFWSYYNSDRKIKVTSDDVIFWYDEIEGDASFQSSGYYGQFLTLPDGTDVRVTVAKIDNLSFAFNFPIEIAEPYLMTNMDWGPKHIYEPVVRQFDSRLANASTEEERAQILSERNNAVRNIFNVSQDPSSIPSMGRWFIAEYTPGQRLVYKRNPDYWKKDQIGTSLPYIEENIVRIIPEENTQLLLFTRGETESYQLRPEDLNTIINNNSGNYTVFNADGALGASFWTFNQNPVNKNKPQYEWFTKKEFRQAMSCLLNRDRLNTQVYRGLAEPKLNIFPEPNPYYNPDITNQYLFDRDRAISLLYSIGFKRDLLGNMKDDKNRRVEFDLIISSDSSVTNDIASIIRDELSKAGIKLNIRVMDFQQQVNLLFEVFDWDSMIIGLSGANIFPSQGSNVWVSNGNLHLWYPNQVQPATQWEARIDSLYNEGKFTLDPEKAQKIWDEFQSILMEELPMIHLMRSRSFWALNNRWDFTNVYFDNMNGAETNYLYLK